MSLELVLNFHGIGTPHSGVSLAERAVWMSRKTFVGLLDHIAALRAVEQIPIVITFDDGNSSDVAIALPELSKRHLEATFFVCAGRLETPKYLGREALRDLIEAGMTIGSHGMHHRDWRTLDESALADEVGTARKRLEDACGRLVTRAAIPFGSYDRRVLGKLRAESFACVYTSDRGLAGNGAWLKPRNTLGPGSKQEDIARLVASGNWPKSILRYALRLYKETR